MQVKLPSTASRQLVPRHTVPRLRSSANNPASVEAMHCYFISVGGDGISVSVSDEQLGTRKASCFGFGALSEMGDLYELTRTGKKFTVPSGSDRTIRVYGVFSSTLGRSCASSTLPEIFRTPTRPRVYLLGETVGDLYRDSRVEVKNEYDSGVADDLAELCASATGSGSEGDPSEDPPITGSRLIVFNTESLVEPTLFNYEMDAVSGRLTQLQSHSPLIKPGNIDVPADGASTVIVGPPSSGSPSIENILHLPMDVSGPSAGLWTSFSNRASLGNNSTAEAVSALTTPYFYFTDVNTILQARYFDSGSPVSLGPDVTSLGVRSLAATPDVLLSLPTITGPSTEFSPTVLTKPRGRLGRERPRTPAYPAETLVPSITFARRTGCSPSWVRSFIPSRSIR